MNTVSFDFDSTLWDEEAQSFIPETVALLRQHIANGDRVIVVTARMKQWALEAWELIQLRLKLDIEVFSAPANPNDKDDPEPTKSKVLIAEGAVLHLDDLADCSSLDAAKEAGIEVRLPPATKVFVARMY